MEAANPDQNQTIENQPSDQSEALASAAPQESMMSVENQKISKKNNKVGLIVGIVLGIVVVALVAATYAWSCIYHDPNKVIADATGRLFNAKNVTLDGTIRLESTDRDSELQALMVTFYSASTNLPNTTRVQIRAMIAEQEETLALDLSTIQMDDGVIYLQFSGIMDALEQLGVKQADLDWVYDVLEIVDNEWWRFDVAELASSLELDADDRQKVENLYACVVDELKNDIRGEIGELYRSNDFITVEKVEEARFANGNSYGKSFEETDYYGLTFDYSKMAGFINGLASTNTMRRIYGCVQDYMPGSDFNASYFDEVTAKELQKIFEDDNEIDIFFEISKWGHELKHILTNVSYDDANITVSIMFTYNDGVQVTAPSNYQPLTELVDEISEAIAEILYGGYYDYIGDYDYYYDYDDYDYDYDYEYDNCSPFGTMYTNCYTSGSTGLI